MKKEIKKINTNESYDAIAELKEWQDHQYNPGYRIGIGRFRRSHLPNKRDLILSIILGTICFIVVVISYINSDKSANSLFFTILISVFSLLYICSGIVRLFKTSNK